MTATPDGRPAYGGPWWCPSCGRATVTPYRCSNWDCAVDLTDADLTLVDP
jgi:hypothetical protein